MHPGHLNLLRESLMPNRISDLFRVGEFAGVGERLLLYFICNAGVKRRL